MKKGYKLCPYCGEEIKEIAKKCRFCGEFLEESGEETNKNVDKFPQKKETTNNKKSFFYLEGRRVNRSQYGSFLLRCFVLFLIAFYFIPTILYSFGFDLFEIYNTKPGIAITFSILGILIYFTLQILFYIVSAKRYHDLGKSSWSILWLFIPIFKIIIIIQLLCLKGNEGINNYGEPNGRKVRPIERIILSSFIALWLLGTSVFGWNNGIEWKIKRDSGIVSSSESNKIDSRNKDFIDEDTLKKMNDEIALYKSWKQLDCNTVSSISYSDCMKIMEITDDLIKGAEENKELYLNTIDNINDNELYQSNMLKRISIKKERNKKMKEMYILEWGSCDEDCNAMMKELDAEVDNMQERYDFINWGNNESLEPIIITEDDDEIIDIELED